jgi:hypothetical protein
MTTSNTMTNSDKTRKIRDIVRLSRNDLCLLFAKTNTAN